MRWLNRDPIEEDGGINLYAFCGNSSVIKCDILGKLSYDLVEKNYPIKSIYSDDISDSTNIWKHIGGKVLVNAEIGVFKNPCAIRLSLTLNKSGLIIPYIEGATSSGRNFDGTTSSKWWYIFRVKDMKKFLSQKLGAAKIYKSRQAFENCAPKGILILDISGWSDATGHATL